MTSIVKQLSKWQHIILLWNVNCIRINEFLLSALSVGCTNVCMFFSFSHNVCTPLESLILMPISQHPCFTLSFCTSYLCLFSRFCFSLSFPSVMCLFCIEISPSVDVICSLLAVHQQASHGIRKALWFSRSTLKSCRVDTENILFLWQLTCKNHMWQLQNTWRQTLLHTH